MAQALATVMAVFAIIGALDKIFGNKLKLGDEFEKGLAKFLNVPYCSLVNSGSSANLLAMMALTSN